MMALKTTSAIGLLVVCIGVAGCERNVSFASDVQPILLENCAECHGQAGEGYETSSFSVLDYESVMTGTQYGAVVDPGSAISSSLYLLVAKKTAPEIQMPPHHEVSLAVGRRAALPDEDVETIRLWIDQGAKDN
ncbi:MAG: hypothetical protein HKN59_09315 [Gammaproteobacteria bacterium]|nr:hypothetical protein [Gammaproteobacteria bacterium]